MSINDYNIVKLGFICFFGSYLLHMHIPSLSGPHGPNNENKRDRVSSRPAMCPLHAMPDMWVPTFVRPALYLRKSLSDGLHFFGWIRFVPVRDFFVVHTIGETEVTWWWERIAVFIFISRLRRVACQNLLTFISLLFGPCPFACACFGFFMWGSGRSAGCSA